MTASYGVPTSGRSYCTMTELNEEKLSVEDLDTSKIYWADDRFTAYMPHMILVTKDHSKLVLIETKHWQHKKFPSAQFYDRSFVNLKQHLSQGDKIKSIDKLKDFG